MGRYALLRVSRREPFAGRGGGRPPDQCPIRRLHLFDPDYRDRGLGVYSILWQIEESRRLGNEWLYLGYWIRECRKMAYKDEYRPLEVYRSNRWIRYGPGEEVDTRQDRLRALNVRLNPYEACRT